ncbi:ATP-binding cassette sub-family G member 2-like [Sinocyclocheilus grahami]|uniref:ATP-binding cassette sub-family G member 2-like n=1 Tax=Sinocyclocheilus grahami TaxID=75366 RepID=UPI0007AD31AE|nr:PREDICTED: ATP-binding cassette sub-family G member 2-like [Sinocyclocheilus grahami]
MTEDGIMLDEVLVNEQPSTDTEETAPCFQTPGPTVTFHSLRYRIKERLGMFSRQWVEKDILRDVSGILSPGMNAIMGPTGSGKTSLLDVIAGRKDPKGLKSGQVLVDNTIVTSDLRLCSAYVVQNDILMGTLTVRENLAFSANLRLSRKEYSSADKQMRVDSVIQELGLKDCADTKMCSNNDEMVENENPLAVIYRKSPHFLNVKDRLTQISDGLDPEVTKDDRVGYATPFYYQLMLVSGRTVRHILRNPQTSYAQLFLNIFFGILVGLIYYQIPHTLPEALQNRILTLLLLRLSKKGKTVIFSIHQPRYSIFSQFDHLTLMNKGEIIYAGAANKAITYFEELGYKCEPFNNPADFFLDVTNGTVLPQIHNNKSEMCSNSDEMVENENPLAVIYRKSPHFLNVKDRLTQISDGLDPEVTKDDRVGYATPFYYQLMLVSGRTVRHILRNPQTSYAQLFLNIFFGILVGLIYYQIPHTLPEALQNRTGAFFFLVINMVFGNLSAVELFISERVLFIHENSSGFYRTSVYFLSKVFADLIPNRILPVFIFSAIPYFMMGLKPDVEAFFLYCVTMSMISLSAVSLAFLISASVGSFAMANILIALPYVVMMWGFWQNQVALTGIMCVCLLLTYVQLRRISRWK